MHQRAPHITLRFYLCACPCVCLSLTNLRVVCKIITCVPAVTEMAIVKAAGGRDQRRYDTVTRLSLSQYIPYHLLLFMTFNFVI